MFNKWGLEGSTVKTDGNGNGNGNGNGRKEEQHVREETTTKTLSSKISKRGVNTILKGSKLVGDINVTCDLELSGDVEGNIKATEDSNIVIKGTCSGNIETKGGSVDIDGELKSGNILAGNDVKISGKFNGGEIKAKGKIYVNGEFNGKLEGNEVEIGSKAHGTGEIIYKEHISISKGAKVEIQISRIQVQEELKVVKNSAEKKEGKVVEIKPSSNEKVKAM